MDIDFFPANGLLYAMQGDGTAYSVDTATGAATLRVTPLTTLSNITDFDFNPQADRLRLFGDTDMNYRMVPDTTTAPSAPGTSGTVISDGTFSNVSFQLVGSAYTNNFDGSTGTTLYSIDTVNNALIIHSGGPQFNTVAQVGSGLGIGDIGTNVGFDIASTDSFGYLSDGNSLYSLNLSTGTASSLGTVGGSGVMSIAAAVPEPSRAVLVFLGLALTTLRRRRTPAAV